MSDFKTKLTIYLAAFVFGLVLPAYLIWLLLLSHFGMQRQTEISKSFSQLSFALDKLEEFSDDKVFYHAMLQRNFRNIDQNGFHREKLEHLLGRLRRKFAGNLGFIVYDNKGNIDQGLTKEKQFQYLLKNMYKTMHLVKEYYDKDPLGNPREIPEIGKRLNLLRSYFGEFLVADELFEPLKDSMRGRCLLASEDSEKRLFWYFPGDNFSLVCFVNRSITRRHLGAKLMIDRFNHQSRVEKLACFDPLTMKSAGFPKSLKKSSELLTEVHKFLEFADPDRISSNFLLHLRQVSFNLVIFSYSERKNIVDPDEAAAGSMLSGFRWFFLVVFLVYCLSLRYGGLVFSVRNKMLLLFVFANGLPFLITVSTGYEFFSEKKKELINSAHQESVRILREFDLRYPELTDAIAQRFNHYLDRQNQKYGREKWPQEEIDKFHQMVKDVRPEEAVLMQFDGDFVFYVVETSTRAEKLIEEILKRAVLFFNTRVEKSMVYKNEVFDQVTSDETVLNFFLGMLDRFTILGAGNNPRHSYMKFVGDVEKSDFWAILGISWGRSHMLQNFITDRLRISSSRVKPRILAVMDPANEMVFSLAAAENSHTRRLMRQTARRKMIAAEDVLAGGEKFLFTSVVGNEISGAILVALYPQKIIEDKVQHLKMLVWLLILVILMVLTGFVKMFSKRLLQPVRALGEGVEHLRNRNYQYSVDYRSEDELGQLVKVFNQTVENMKELALGTSVQESLLPPGKHRCRRIELFAHSVFMTKMGGDYFDYFDFGENRMVLFFGDVAGHGIPAAMIMAMVKAVITGNRRSFVGPAELLQQANQCLLQLKKRGWRRMMTAQAIEMDCESGRFNVANAGHSYPYVVSKNGTAVKQIKILGMPLGSTSRTSHQEHEFELAPGDTMVLYSDGIIESRGPGSELFGYERFEELLAFAWSDNLEQYWENIMAANSAWAQAQDDDLTFMLIRHLEEA